MPKRPSGPRSSEFISGLPQLERTSSAVAAPSAATLAHHQVFRRGFGTLASAPNPSWQNNNSERIHFRIPVSRSPLYRSILAQNPLSEKLLVTLERTV